MNLVFFYYNLGQSSQKANLKKMKSTQLSQRFSKNTKQTQSCFALTPSIKKIVLFWSFFFLREFSVSTSLVLAVCRVHQGLIVGKESATGVTGDEVSGSILQAPFK